MKGSIKITNRICKGLFIVYYSFNFGKENTTISGKTIEGQPYAYPPPQTSTETQIMMILIIYQTLPAALIENSHFNSKLVCLAMLKLYSKVLAKPSPLVSRWRASFQSRHAGIVWYILETRSVFIILHASYLHFITLLFSGKIICWDSKIIPCFSSAKF